MRRANRVSRSPLNGAAEMGGVIPLPHLAAWIWAGELTGAGYAVAAGLLSVLGREVAVRQTLVDGDSQDVGQYDSDCIGGQVGPVATASPAGAVGLEQFDYAAHRDGGEEGDCYFSEGTVD